MTDEKLDALRERAGPGHPADVLCYIDAVAARLTALEQRVAAIAEEARIQAGEISALLGRHRPAKQILAEFREKFGAPEAPETRRCPCCDGERGKHYPGCIESESPLARLFEAPVPEPPHAVASTLWRVPTHGTEGGPLCKMVAYYEDGSEVTSHEPQWQRDRGYIVAPAASAVPVARLRELVEEWKCNPFQRIDCGTAAMRLNELIEKEGT